MKTLDDHVILYDKECPLCNFYTAAFIETKMLDPNGRAAYTEADSLIARHKVNRPKACDEIALINTKTGHVKYGVDSLTHILQNRFPALSPLFANRVIQYFMSSLYSFISFNRKVIVPGRDIDDPKACRPSFSLRYRLAYLIFAWLITSLILTNYALHLSPLVPATNFYREFLICGGQIVFQAIIIGIINKEKLFDYLGNMMTVSLAGALLLFMILPLTSIVSAPEVFAILFTIVVGLMFLEHIRRVSLLKLPWIMTFSWVVYRILILAVLLT